VSQVFAQLYLAQSCQTLADLVLPAPEPLKLSSGCRCLFFPSGILRAWLMLLRRDLLRSYGKNICLFLLIELVFFLDFLLCRIVCLVLFRLGFFYLGFDLFVYFEDILLF
jgi:hypothetical protein